MKFLGDMGISPRTIEYLRSLDHDATHLHEQGLDTLPDANILEKARAEGAILLTSDLDFGELVMAGGTSLPSVIIFRLRPPMHADKVNRHLQRVLQLYTHELQQGCMISVTEDKSAFIACRPPRLPAKPRAAPLSRFSRPFASFAFQTSFASQTSSPSRRAPPCHLYHLHKSPCA